ncbi:DNA-binding protein inhibitor ID-4-like [Arapaima gigas]
MKAVSPVLPQRDSPGCGAFTLRCPAERSLPGARRRTAEEELLCLRYTMNDCYSRLKRLVPTIPQDKKVSKVEILQHVIDYILDLQLALETHPVLMKQNQNHQQNLHRNHRGTMCPSSRTPLTVLNTEQASSIIQKQEDTILCR